MRKHLAGALLLATLAGCGSDKKATGNDAALHAKDMNQSSAMSDPMAFMPQDVYEQADGVPVQAKRVYYFSFDKSVVAPEDYAELERHAEYLKFHPETKVRIEGHTDERGSPEYNIGLGERRAKSIVHALHSMGVMDVQMETVSYGKQKLADARDTEEAHAKNRRAVVIYEREMLAPANED